VFSRAITFSPRHSASPVISVTEAHSMVTCTSVLLTRCFYFLKPQSFRSDMPQSDKPQSFRSDQPGLVASRRASRWRSQNPSHRMKPLSSDETPRPPEGYFSYERHLGIAKLQSSSMFRELIKPWGLWWPLGVMYKIWRKSLWEKNSVVIHPERNTVEDHGDYGGHWVSCRRFGEKACEKMLRPGKTQPGQLLLDGIPYSRIASGWHPI